MTGITDVVRKCCVYWHGHMGLLLLLPPSVQGVVRSLLPVGGAFDPMGR